MLNPAAPPLSHADDREGQLRARELFRCVRSSRRKHEINRVRYFRPVSLPVSSSGSPPTREDPVRPRARLSHDTVLTSLAQLALYKTGCKHALISLFDHQNQYILADTSNAGSIVHSSQNKSDELIGPSIVDRSIGLGTSAVELFSSRSGGSHAPSGDRLTDKDLWSVSDLSKDALHNKKPFVKRFGHLKFCAQVPIRSNKGYVLGTLCVLDQEPRHSLSDLEVEGLKEVAIGVFEHLNLLKSRSNHNRAERLVRALGLFNEGGSSVRKWWLDDSENLSRSETLTADEKIKDLEDRADREFGEVHKPDSISKLLRVNHNAHVPQGETTSELPNYEEMKSQNNPNAANVDASSSKSYSNLLSSKIDLPAFADMSLPQAIRVTFSRASNLIREAVELEGVVFMDTCWNKSRPNDTGNSIFRQNSSEREWSDSENETIARPQTAKSSTSKSTTTPPRSRSGKAPYSNRCEVLGYSTRQRSSIAGNKISPSTPIIREKTLRGLLKRYPQGTIFTFESDGTILTSEDDTDPYQPPLPQEKSSAFLHDANATAPSQKQRQHDAETLLKLFPGVRSIAFFPLWDFNSSRWYAGTLAWTADSTRVLEREELTYFGSFCNSIMNEVSRIEMEFLGRAKSNFAPSLSHELRSPLHGVLGSVELLHDTNPSPAVKEIIQMIEICSRTLLDTLNHLLDFSKIDNHTGTLMQTSETEKQEWALGQDSNFDIAEVVEEVVRSVFTGHVYSNSSSSLFHMTENRSDSSSAILGERDASSEVSVGTLAQMATKNTMVVVDIEKHDNWRVHSQIGAWKRLLMNLLGNALKYTQTGIICIALRNLGQSSTNPIKKSTISLTVSDTGRGISREFMKHQAFKPFSQENPLSVGVGLGLSIVQQIASTIGATIDMESDPGVGTKVTISSDLERVQMTDSQNQLHQVLQATRVQVQNYEACLLGFDLQESLRSTQDLRSATAKQLSALKPVLVALLTDWLGMSVNSASSLQGLSPDFIFVHEVQLQTICRSNLSEEVKQLLQNLPVIVLCSGSSNTTKLLPKQVNVTSPIDPRKVVTAVKKSLSDIANINSLSDTDRAQPANILDEYKDPWLNLPSRSSRTHEPLDSLQSLSRPAAPVVDSSGTSDSEGAAALLVDDNDVNLRVLSGFMKKLFYTHKTCQNGLEAFNYYQKAEPKPEIIFMDISMPVMDGFQASWKIRCYEKDNQLPSVKIVALTGLGNSEAKKAESNGMNLFLTKPVRFKAIEAILADQNQDPNKN